jgi:hypothetical protein
LGAANTIAWNDFTINDSGTYLSVSVTGIPAKYNEDVGISLRDTYGNWIASDWANIENSTARFNLKATAGTYDIDLEFYGEYDYDRFSLYSYSLTSGATIAWSSLSRSTATGTSKRPSSFERMKARVR